MVLRGGPFSVSKLVARHTERLAIIDLKDKIGMCPDTEDVVGLQGRALTALDTALVIPSEYGTPPFLITGVAQRNAPPSTKSTTPVRCEWTTRRSFLAWPRATEAGLEFAGPTARDALCVASRVPAVGTLRRAALPTRAIGTAQYAWQELLSVGDAVRITLASTFGSGLPDLWQVGSVFSRTWTTASIPVLHTIGSLGVGCAAIPTRHFQKLPLFHATYSTVFTNWRAV